MRFHLIDYHLRKKLEIPTLLDQTIDHRTTHAEANPGNPGRSHVVDNITNHEHDVIKTMQIQGPLVRPNKSDDSWEPLSSLPSNKIIAYHKRIDILLPSSLEDSSNGQIPFNKLWVNNAWALTKIREELRLRYVRESIRKAKNRSKATKKYASPSQCIPLSEKEKRGKIQ